MSDSQTGKSSSRKGHPSSSSNSNKSDQESHQTGVRASGITSLDRGEIQEKLQEASPSRRESFFLRNLNTGELLFLQTDSPGSSPRVDRQRSKSSSFSPKFVDATGPLKGWSVTPTVIVTDQSGSESSLGTHFEQFFEERSRGRAQGKKRRISGRRGQRLSRRLNEGQSRPGNQDRALSMRSSSRKETRLFSPSKEEAEADADDEEDEDEASGTRSTKPRPQDSKNGAMKLSSETRPTMSPRLERLASRSQFRFSSPGTIVPSLSGRKAPKLSEAKSPYSRITNQASREKSHNSESRPSIVRNSLTTPTSQSPGSDSDDGPNLRVLTVIVIIVLAYWIKKALIG